MRIGTKLRGGWPRKRGLILGTENRLRSSPKRPDYSVALPASNPMGTRRIWVRCEVHHSPPSNEEAKNGGAVTPLSSTPSWLGAELNTNLYLYSYVTVLKKTHKTYIKSNAWCNSYSKQSRAEQVVCQMLAGSRRFVSSTQRQHRLWDPPSLLG